MKEFIKTKEVKGVFSSLLLICLAIFLIAKPAEIVSTLIKVMGVFILICGVFDFSNYFLNKDEDKLFNYNLVKGIMEITVGIMFIFKYNLLISLFPSILGLVIVFINIVKLETALSLKSLDGVNNSPLIIISTLSIITGIIILMNPFEAIEVVVRASGIVLLISEVSNIIYSVGVLRFIRKSDNLIIESKEEE